jgi:hypothetical protein
MPGGPLGKVSHGGRTYAVVTSAFLLSAGCLWSVSGLLVVCCWALDSFRQPGSWENEVQPIKQSRPSAAAASGEMPPSTTLCQCCRPLQAFTARATQNRPGYTAAHATTINSCLPPAGYTGRRVRVCRVAGAGLTVSCECLEPAADRQPAPALPCILSGAMLRAGGSLRLQPLTSSPTSALCAARFLCRQCLLPSGGPPALA